jgi:ABC-type dipeptide/oligopeptide/nickel transport system permease subunit
MIAIFAGACWDNCIFFNALAKAPGIHRQRSTVLHRFPSAATALAVLGCSLLGDGRRDLLNPKL